MSGQPPIRPEQGSYGQFQVATSQPKTLYSRSKDILAKLRESIPQNETQWQQARDLHGYSTAGNVLQKTRDILENRITKQDLRNFLTIASCCVDWHLGRKQEAYQRFKMQISAATELTIQKYMSSLRAMVQAMEPVYLRGPRHRVFEGTLLYSRIGPSFLTHYTKETGAFDSCFPAFSCTHPETQASLPLAPAFILKYRHPQQSFGDICAALCTEVLDEDDYAKFICVLERGRPIPTVLSLPAKAPYTALSVIKCQPEPAGDDQRASANPVDDLDMFALPKSFPLVYKVFGISDAVQQLLQEVTHRINFESLREVPNTPLLEFQWIDNYDMVVDQVVVDLIEQIILPQQPFRRFKSFYRHKPGSISVPSGWIKIIVPITLVHQVCHVSIATTTVAKQNITWDTKVGLILGSDVLFSTSQQILYHSISIPLGSDNR
ncbi:hypothetical protein FOXG_22022 [Fusarium oxysporum f. sp. lycopersici 4287]|uniref:Uncharacterized protein n=1 Tax=Fusarium oxysporum f. sp. lycopersici (strain 4287 / CBS 123668 / FGSC 9935 / NRRL 34936) TaxID=426428 RepID=A0A0J9W4D4_FUSO4|nr:hypothetical protein FOXG_22022 [Fusarium oxysporum f. sp. lycopersici 4287]KAJ9427880.1 hypothetical protein QL093DRAFT_2570747 [Fusarium oxysporum]KNB17735.1 hypothetical protein FOXG_22022 [Fusarium oxysporum f. sp. lycopersici 4287]